MRETSQGQLGIDGWSLENVLICIAVDRQLVASPGPEQMHTQVRSNGPEFQSGVLDWRYRSEFWIGGMDRTFGFCSKEQDRQQHKGQAKDQLYT